MQGNFSEGDACNQLSTAPHRHALRGGIFMRTFFAFLAITLVTVLLFTFILAASLQSQRQSAYEEEVRAQAREVASYMAHLNQIQFVFESSTMRYVLYSKMQTIHDRYNADIWIVSYESGQIRYQYLDSGGNIVDPKYITSESVFEQIALIYQGNEIRAQGLFPELGEDITTIGVPWTYSDGHVVGAVLLHISEEDLRVGQAMNVFDASEAYSVAVYLNGTKMFYALQEQIGADVLYQGLANYYEACRFGIAGKDQLIHALENITGRSLQSFFQQWL